MSDPRHRRTGVLALLVLSAFGPGCPDEVSVKPFARGTYLQSGAPDGAVVRWRTLGPTTTAVWLGSSPDSLGLRISDPVSVREHEVRLTGLAPDTEYFYAIGDDAGILAGGDPDHRFRTPPATGVGRPTRIWVIGDFGFGNAGSRAVRDAYLADPGGRQTDVWLTVGDNAYPLGTDVDFQRGLFNTYPTILRSTFFWPAFGNHDGYSADSESESGVYYDIFTLPRQGEAGGLASGTEAYYSFDHGDIHFVCLVSYDTDRSAAGEMMTWLQDDLALSSAKWIIAYWHHPPYSRGSHDSDDDLRMREMREVAVPILEAGGVDLILSGHSHSYERTCLLDGHYGTSDTLTPAMKLDPGDGRELGDGAYVKAGSGAHGGAVHAVVGSSGITAGGRLDHPAMAVSLNTLGSMVIDIDGDRLDARFLDSAGHAADEFTVLKGVQQSLTRDAARISLTTGGTQTLFLDAGVEHAGREYVLSRSSGTSPTVRFPPLDDRWPNGLVMTCRGFLDQRGRAQVAVEVPSLTDPSLVGGVFHHAFVVVDGSRVLLSSNAVKLTLKL